MLALQMPLTDAFIESELERIHQGQISTNTLYIVIAAATAVICLFLCYLKFKRSEGDLRKLMMSLMALCVFGGLGAEIFLLNMRQTYKEIAEIASEWHVIESTITDLELDEDTYRRRTSDGRRKTRTTVSYYAEFSGISGKVTLTSAQYHSYAVGDEVYLVINSAGNIEVLYQKDEYEYTGNRLK